MGLVLKNIFSKEDEDIASMPDPKQGIDNLLKKYQLVKDLYDEDPNTGPTQPPQNKPEPAKEEGTNDPQSSDQNQVLDNEALGKGLIGRAMFPDPDGAADSPLKVEGQSSGAQSFNLNEALRNSGSLAEISKNMVREGRFSDDWPDAQPGQPAFSAIRWKGPESLKPDQSGDTSSPIMPHVGNTDDPDGDEKFDAESLAANFVSGIGDTAYGLTIGTALNAKDLMAAGASVSWNELGLRDAYNWATGNHAPKFYADMVGPTAQAYKNGESQEKLVLSSLPVANLGVLGFDMSNAVMSGDWNAVARMGGGIAAGAAVGKGVGRYGNYNLRSPIYAELQSGTNLYSAGPFNLRNPLFKSFDFGAHLRKLKGPPPSDMIDPHAHHILFKEGNGPAQKALVKEGQEILNRFDIDPIMGEENLTWAPNRVATQHGIETLRNIVNSLKEIEEAGGDRTDVTTKLNELGEAAANRK